MDWAKGYVADVSYTAGFYREMAPVNMSFAALSIGRSPGRAFRPKKMLELGFGQGFGLSLLAAANPDISFEGYDFNPEHVAHARRMIGDAKLENITVSESSFEEVAAKGGKDDLDVIALHGIFTWVSRSAQDAIISIIRQRLQPDGIVYISYNCMPGWAPIAPIRELMLEVKRRNAGRSERQLALALETITKLKQGGAGYFVVNAGAAQHVDQMMTLDRNYLAHEYLDENWEIFRFADLAARMGEAKLSFVASSTLTENLDQYAVPASLHSLITQTDDPIMRETLRDYACNKRFRRDLFSRSMAQLTPPEHLRLIHELSFVLCVPRKNVGFKFQGPLTELTGKDEFYAPIVDKIADKPATLAELIALPQYGETKIGMLLDCLCLLVHSGQVAPILNGADNDKAPAQRFNRAVVDYARTGRVYGGLASPLLRSGVGVRDLGLLALAAVYDGKGDDAAMAAQHAMSILNVLGRRPMKDGVVIQDDGDAIAFLISSFRPILEVEIPLLQRLGVL